MSKRKPLAHASDPIKACADLMRQAAYRHRLHQVFADFCEMAAISLSNAVDVHHREAREAQYLQIVGRYERAEVELFPQMLARLVDGLEAGPTDFLGQLFMGLELGNHWTGQFFTPFEVSRLMAGMTLGELSADDIAARGGFITVNEPACGAGGMVLAVADALRAQGLNFQRVMHATLQDIDPTAVHMAYVQCALMHIPAIVLQGNSLAVEVRDYWLTPAHVLGGWDRKLAARAATEVAAEPLAAPVEAAPAASVPLAPAAAHIVTARLQADQLALF